MSRPSPQASALEALLSTDRRLTPEEARTLTGSAAALGAELETEQGALLALASVGRAGRWLELEREQVVALVEDGVAVLVGGGTLVVEEGEAAWQGLAPEDTEEPAWPARCLVVQGRSTGAVEAPRGALTKLWAFLKPDRRDLIAVVLFAAGMGVLNLATPIAVQALVNFVALGGTAPQLVVVTGLLLLGLTFAAGLGAVQAWVVEIVQRRLFVRVVAELGDRLPRWTWQLHQQRQGPELVNRFFDIITIQKTSASLLLGGVTVLLSVVTGLLVLAFYHPLLLAFDAVLLAAIALLVFAPLRRGMETALRESSAKYAVAAWFDEVVSQPVLFRSPGVQAWLRFHTDRVTREYVTRRGAHYRVLFGQILGAGALYVVASTGLLALGGWLVLEGSLTLGQLVAAELIVTLVVGSVAKLGKHLESFYDLVAAIEKVSSLLEQPQEPVGGEPVLESGEAGKPAALAWQGLSLHGSDGSLLARVPDASLAPGDRAAVVGPGAAQQGLLHLLWGLREVEAGGRVSVDGTPLEALSRAGLRRSVAYLGPRQVLAGSVLDNVRAGRTRITDAAIRASLARVGQLEVLDRLPDGLDTRLGPEGWPLGPSQLLAVHLARVLVDPPRLLLVEDSFSSLPAPARQPLLDALLDPDAPWTLLLATQDPSLVARCSSSIELREPERALTA